MIRKLRVKFICIVMSIVMVMVGVILGVVIHFTASNMELQSISMMRTIADSPFQLGNPGNPSEEIRLPFFTVQIGRRGDLLAASSGYFDLSDRDTIQQLVNEALSSAEDTGTLKQNQLRFLKVTNPNGLTVVFADTTNEVSTLRSLVIGCGLIFFAAMVVFLAVSILLSRWAVRPVEQAWDQQRQFVADASHELKTPLAVILSNAELMQSSDTAEQDRQTCAGNILTMSYQMRALVESLLEMARVDNGTLRIHMEPVDLSQLVSDAALSFQLLYEERDLGLERQIEEGLTICGSEQHLYQVLDVLLDNALKYSSPAGTVTVRLLRTDRTCLLRVTSPGEALSKEDLTNIFKRFYRADKARAMNGSYGLGLSIAMAIVTTHKGKIWAESKNGLNTFFVQFPMAHPK